MKNKKINILFGFVIVACAIFTGVSLLFNSQNKLFVSEKTINVGEVERTELTYTSADITVSPKIFTGENIIFAVEDVVAPEYTIVTAVENVEEEDYLNVGTPHISVTLSISTDGYYKFMVDGLESFTKTFEVEAKIEKAELTYTADNISILEKTYTGEYISFAREDVIAPAYTTATGITTVLGQNYFNAGTPRLDITLSADDNHKFVVNGEDSQIKGFKVNATIRRKELIFTATDVSIIEKEYTGSKITFSASDITAPDNTSVKSIEEVTGQNYVTAGTKKLKITFEVVGTNHTFILNNEEVAQKAFETDIVIKRKVLDTSTINITKNVVFNNSIIVPTASWFENVPSIVSITSIGAVKKNGETTDLKNAGLYSITLTITADSNHIFAENQTSTTIQAAVEILKAHLSVYPKSSYIYQSGTNYIAQRYNNSATLSTPLLLNTHYYILCTGGGIAPSLEYSGTHSIVDVGSGKLTVNFELQSADVNNYIMDNTSILLNGKITPAPAQITFDEISYSYVYGQTAAIPSATCSPNNLEITYKYVNLGNFDSSTAPTLPGNYYVVASVSGNYEGSARVPYIIEKMLPDVGTLQFTDRSVVYSNAEKTLLISGSIPNYIAIKYTYQRKISNDQYGPITDNKPINPGTYKVKAKISVVPNNYYKDFEEETFLIAYLTILSKEITASSNQENTANGSIENEEGIDPNAIFEIAKNESGQNIQSSPMGYTILQSYTATLKLNGTEITPETTSVIIVKVDETLDLHNTKILVYEDGKVVEKLFILTINNEIAFLSDGLGEFAIATSPTYIWLLWGSAGILAVIGFCFIFVIIRSRNGEKREKQKEEKKMQKQQKSEIKTKQEEKLSSRQEEIEKLLNISNKFKK